MCRGPGLERCRHAHRQLIPRNERVRRLEVLLCRHRAVLQRQCRLDHASDTGCRFEMTDVRLDRRDHERLVGVTLRAKYVCQRAHLDRIAECGPGAVRLHESNLSRFELRIGESIAQHRLLRRPTGCGETVAAPVLVRCRAANHSDDAIACRLRIVEALEHEHAAAFTAHEAISARIERLAASIGRHHVRPGQCNRDFRPQYQVHAARQCHVRFATTQSLHRLVNRHHRRRARRIDRDTRPARSEYI